MKITEVTENDAKLVSKALMMIQAGEWTMNGKDFCQAADAIRWLQNTAVIMAQSLQDSRNVTSEPAKVDAAPKSGLPEGVAVKSFSPGKPGKK